ncbi:MAG: sugar ABC transporter ATP-binding protein [Clostridiales bacterium]|nr:sugar ABC transporter ATP-binding protein [Clostridiales bacterium]
MEDCLMKIENLTKSFPGVLAVDGVSFDIKRNTVHCLVGENGAGKSTLIKVITGAHIRTGGKIWFNGEDYEPQSTKDAMDSGISTLFQELNIVNELTVEENLILGGEDTTLSFIRKTEKMNKMIDVLKEIDDSMNPKTLVEDLSVAQKQLVEIAKAIATEAEIIIMDEPTAAISENEIKKLFRIIKKLKEDKVTFIYISHRLDEIFEIGDYVTVMRDGKHIATKAISEIENRDELIKMMIGKTVFQNYMRGTAIKPVNILEAKGVTNEKLADVSFSVQEGEIVGFYGLVGSGKTELSRALFGLDGYLGEVHFCGAKLEGMPNARIAKGMVLVPEERRTQGLFTSLSVKRNISITNLKSLIKRGFINSKMEDEVAGEYIGKLSIATSGPDKEVAYLSGGNQQKVVFAKCLFANSSMLILDEPTRGVDVGAKAEIYTIIRELANEGKAILFFSSELPEILDMCDRIFLLVDGQIKDEIENGGDIDQNRILHIVTGGAMQ